MPLPRAARHLLQLTHEAAEVFPNRKFLIRLGSLMKGRHSDIKSVSPRATASSIAARFLHPPTGMTGILPVTCLIIFAASRLYPSNILYSPALLSSVFCTAGLCFSGNKSKISFTGISPLHIFQGEIVEVPQLTSRASTPSEARRPA